MEVKKRARVTIVGAGPGAEDLITLKGYRILQEADVVLYDALVSETQVARLSDSILKIYVGKRCGLHSFTQNEINDLMVKNALEYGHVVRLKGGDPFVFGRASEEIAYVESFGIPVSVVPGISSAIAVPSSQGIPMTKRGVSSSFWVVTATKRDGSYSQDLRFASMSSTTMVILMGIRKLGEIIENVSKYRGSMTPIAIIQNGTTTKESCVVATLGTIFNHLDSIPVDEAGIIVIGDVVMEHPSFFEEEVQRVLHAGF